MIFLPTKYMKLHRAIYKLQRIHYLAADGTRADDWEAIEQRCSELSRVYGTGRNVLF